MAGLSKYLTVCLVVILAVSMFLMINSTNAQTIPKPSIPEFTIQIVAYPYDVPTTTTIDQYSGKEIIHQGYHVENNSIQVRIKNQAFNPFDITENGNSWTINLCYNIRIRGHFAEQSQDWIELYYASDGYPHPTSDSDYTILSYHLRVESHTFLGTKMIDLRAGDKVDFQVEAMSGYTTREVTSIPGSGWIFTGETSGWSNTQTITIPETSTSTSQTPNPTPTPTIPELSWLALLPLLLSVFAIAVIVRHRKAVHG
jgi:hypothetical protein